MKLLSYAIEYGPLTFLWVTMWIAAVFEVGFVNSLLVAILIVSLNVVYKEIIRLLDNWREGS
jgi:hypothetical protein